MKKISEYKNKDAVNLLADLLDPVSEIVADPKFSEMANNKDTTKIALIQYIMKAHAESLIKMFAIIDGVPVEEYEINAVEIPTRLVSIFNDTGLANFFK